MQRDKILSSAVSGIGTERCNVKISQVQKDTHDQTHMRSLNILISVVESRIMMGGNRRLEIVGQRDMEKCCLVNTRL